MRYSTDTRFRQIYNIQQPPFDLFIYGEHGYAVDINRKDYVVCVNVGGNDWANENDMPVYLYNILNLASVQRPVGYRKRTQEDGEFNPCQTTSKLVKRLAGSPRKPDKKNLVRRIITEKESNESPEV